MKPDVEARFRAARSMILDGGQRADMAMADAQCEMQDRQLFRDAVALALEALDVAWKSAA